MPDILKPNNRDDVEAAVRAALADGRPLEIVGHGSKRALGRPVQTDAILDLSGLAGVTLYEPEELVLSAQAGTALADIEALLASNGQHLAFEPMDHGPLFGNESGRGTIGGAIAANVCGPRRISAGSARDHVLGVVAVSGRGETFRSGGRVVKNVTGYDLCKLLAGSWGTLGVMTEVTVKVLPRPPAEVTLARFGLDEETGLAAMATAMGSPACVCGAAHLPDYVVPHFDAIAGAGAATVLRIEGIAGGIAGAIAQLRNAVPLFASCEVLEADASRALWRAIRDVRPFWPGGAEAGERALWRVSTAPSQGLPLARKISPSAQLFYDWAGGLLWIAPSPVAPDCGAGEIRAAVAAVGGHATLIRAPAAVRSAVGAFTPEAAALGALTRRVKESFDPKGVLNPGRMWAGV
jgi:glycolate oxidase FAD binding subunit